MSSYQCYPNFLAYQNAVSSGQAASAAALLQGLCANKCYEAIPSINCPSTPPPVTPPRSPSPTVINNWYNVPDTLPPDCAGLQQAYTNAIANNDYVTAMEAAGKISMLNSPTCTVPTGQKPPAGGFSCDVAYRIYTNQNGMFNEQAKSLAYQSLVANNCPQVVPSGKGPAPFDCAATQQQYIQALQNGLPTADLYHLLIINGCSVPDNSVYCSSYMKQFTDAYNAKDVSGMQAAIAKLSFAGCALPGTNEWNQNTSQPVYPETPQQIACDQLHAQYVEVKGMNGDVSQIVASMCTNNCTIPPGENCGPSVNPCTGEQSLTLVDYLITLPLSGIKDDPILALVIGGVGAAGGLVTVTILIPEAGMYARIPAACIGLYGGLIVNGILDNYDWIKNAEKYGIVFGTLVSGLGAVSGLYQSIHNTTEKFLKTEIGGVAGEIVYKVGEGIISGGLFPVYDILFGDKTWTTAGYDKAKCDAGCENPSLSSTKRKLCKLGARLDLKF